MKPETRQTLIGVTGLSVTEGIALFQGIDGMVLTAYFVAVIALITPEALDRLPQWQ